MFIPYSGYFSWGKIFAELQHNVLLNADFFAEANFWNSFIDIHKVQSKLAVVYAHNGETLICQIVQYCGPHAGADPEIEEGRACI